eukprot:8584363-Lingulodinium_polyedra.AAC.1
MGGDTTPQKRRFLSTLPAARRRWRRRRAAGARGLMPEALSVRDLGTQLTVGLVLTGMTINARFEAAARVARRVAALHLPLKLTIQVIRGK